MVTALALYLAACYGALGLLWAAAEWRDRPVRVRARPEEPVTRPEIDPEVYAAFPELYRPHRSHA